MGINAYDQPGVEAGKKAATTVIELQARLIKALQETAGAPSTAEALAGRVSGDPETAFKILEHTRRPMALRVRKTAKGALVCVNLRQMNRGDFATPPLRAVKPQLA